MFIHVFFEKKINIDRFYRSFKIILILSVIILSSKQIQRYFEYYKVREPIPLINFQNEKDISKKYKKITIDEKFEYYWSDIMCMYYLAPCTNQNPQKLSTKKCLDMIYCIDYLILQYINNFYLLCLIIKNFNYQY